MSYSVYICAGLLFGSWVWITIAGSWCWIWGLRWFWWCFWAFLWVRCRSVIFRCWLRHRTSFFCFICWLGNRGCLLLWRVLSWWRWVFVRRVVLRCLRCSCWYRVCRTVFWGGRLSRIVFLCIAGVGRSIRLFWRGVWGSWLCGLVWKLSTLRGCSLPWSVIFLPFIIINMTEMKRRDLLINLWLFDNVSGELWVVM